jgi:hypothetical protein
MSPTGRPTRSDLISCSDLVFDDKLEVRKRPALRGDELFQLGWSVELFGRCVSHPVTGEQFIDEGDSSFVAHFRNETAYHALVLNGHRILIYEHGQCIQFD